MGTHLGNTISSKGSQGNVSLPERRCHNLHRASKHLLWLAANNKRLVCSDLLRAFTGQAVSAISAILLTMFHLRSLYDAKERFRPRFFLTPQAILDLKFWRNITVNHPCNGRPIWLPEPSTALTTDASGSSGFGSVLEVPQQATRESGGFWES